MANEVGNSKTEQNIGDLLVSVLVCFVGVSVLLKGTGERIK